jgi:hypothetical protein
MLDWASRVDDLADKLAREHAVDDRLAVEILLATLVGCPRTASPWLILETDWYDRQCLDAWFSFGQLWAPCTLARLRARSPWRVIEAEMKEMLDAPPRERLFIECDYERYPIFNRLTQARYILQRSLRIRVRSARAPDPLRSLDQRDKDRRTDELSAAARYALEDHAGLRPVDPPRFVEPPNFLYHVELVQRLAPWYPDWKILVQAFALIAIRRAYLHGRLETDETDTRAMARVLGDSIPPWVRKALGVLVEGPSKTQTMEKRMQLEEKTKRSGHGAHRELVRLHRAGIVWWNKQGQTWNIVEKHREGVRAALENRAFTGARAAGVPAGTRVDAGSTSGTSQ